MDIRDAQTQIAFSTDLAVFFGVIFLRFSPSSWTTKSTIQLTAGHIATKDKTPMAGLAKATTSHAALNTRIHPGASVTAMGKTVLNHVAKTMAFPLPPPIAIMTMATLLDHSNHAVSNARRNAGASGTMTEMDSSRAASNAPRSAGASGTMTVRATMSSSHAASNAPRCAGASGVMTVRATVSSSHAASNAPRNAGNSDETTINMVASMTDVLTVTNDSMGKRSSAIIKKRVLPMRILH